MLQTSRKYIPLRQKTNTQMIIQFLFVLAAIVVGAKLGGIGLGVMGGLGLAVLTFVFDLQPTAPPIDVMLMIAAGISAAAWMQAAGGLDYLVKLAERILRRNPAHITILAPLVTYTFTFLAGTGHIAYSLLPVISEVALESKIRPERPLAIATIASQQGITASPISAATVALLGMLTGFGITLFDILKICIPATIIGVLAGAFYSMHVGKELADDPEYIKRVKAGLISNKKRSESNDVKSLAKARLSVIIFVLTTLLIVVFGSIPSLRPSFNGEAMGMPLLIEILMLSAAALILLTTRINGTEATKGSVFSAGMQAVIAIFGIAWMGDTFIKGNIAELTSSIEGIITQMPWLFGLALFVMSILLYSQAATIRAIAPLGLLLGIPPMMLIALFPAVNGYFFIPNYPTIIAAINFDRTGTTRIGKWVLNHSFMMPGLITTAVSIGVGLLLIQIF